MNVLLAAPVQGFLIWRCWLVRRPSIHPSSSHLTLTHPCPLTVDEPLQAPPRWLPSLLRRRDRIRHRDRPARLRLRL